MSIGLSHHVLINGLVAFLFAATGPLVILLAVATGGGMAERDIGTWIFGGYAIGGAMTVLFSLWYRQPIAISWTIPGMVLIGQALGHLPFSDIVGAFLGTAVLLAVLGLTGWVGRVMAAMPAPLVMGMVAGVFLPFALRMMQAFESAFWVAFAMVVGFVAVSAVPRLARLLPPILVALAAGVMAMLFQGSNTLPQDMAFRVVAPVLYAPTLSMQAMLELVIPLTVTVIGIQNAQGFFILRKAGYRPPENVLTVACGAGSVAFAVFGCVPTCVTGPANAILNASGALAERYWAAVVFGLLMILFGVFSPVATGLGLALPTAFVATLGGLALLNVLRDAFVAAFSGGFRLGALVAFLVTVSELTLFHIGAPFWGLVFGYLVARLLEREDFRRLAEARIGEAP
jgi:benzoate membrane transport protein